jgi:hypothetical protein
MSDPLTDKMIDASDPDLGGSKRGIPDQAAPDVSTESALPGEQSQPVTHPPGETGRKLKPLPPEVLQKLGRKTDQLICRIVTVIGKRSDPSFTLTREEIEKEEFGECLWEVINFYIPQIDAASPWIPLAMSGVGLAGVIAAKWPDKKKVVSTKKAATPPALPPPSKETEGKKEDESKPTEESGKDLPVA